MRGLINSLFKKNGQFRPQVGQVVEVEWSEPGVKETILYGKVAEIKKKTLVIDCNSGNQPKLGPGIKVRICSLSPPWFFSYVANIHGNETRGLEVSMPASADQLENLQVPSFDEEEKLDYATTVDYQASRSPYKQAAEVIAVGRKGLTLQTNVSIPSQTSLEIHLKLPNRSEPLPAQVKAVRVDTTNPLKDSDYGGVILSTLDGRIMCDNTLTTRLDLAFDAMAPIVRDTLFGANPNRKHVDKYM